MAVFTASQVVGQSQQRWLNVRTDGQDVPVVDMEARTVTFPFSSESPVERGFGKEVLSHAPGCADLKRINRGGSLLFNHDMNDLLGVVESAWVGADRRGYVTVRFGKDERGSWALQQVADRILQNVSFMYVIRDVVMTDDGYTVTNWEAMEVSLVTIPADPSVGVGRSAGSATPAGVVVDPANPAATADPQTSDNEEQAMLRVRKTHTPLQNQAGEPSGGGSVAPAASVPQVDPAKLEAERVAEIEAMCRTHSIDDNTRNLLVSLKQPIEQARGIVCNMVLERNKGQVVMGRGFNPDLTEKEKQRYSVTKALRAAVAQRMNETNAWKDAGFELEVSKEIAKRSGKDSGALFVPTNLSFSRAADYSVGTGAGLSSTSGGATLVANNLMTGSFIEVLRNKSRVMSLGAQMLSGLVGNVDIPRQKSAGNTYWIGEGGQLPQSGASFDKISLTPKHIGALSVITRNMLQQSTPDIEALVRADLIQTVALGIDLAALSGTGAGGQPLGIVNQSGIGSVIGGTNGAAITLDHLIDLETAVTSRNVDESNLAYLSNAKVVGALKKLKSTTGQYLWTNSPSGQRSGTPGEINGYTFARTNQARSNLTKGTGTNLSEIIFGDWTQVIIGEWGVIEILPNPYAPGIYEQAGVELRVLQTLDVGCRHGEAFSVMSDAIA